MSDENNFTDEQIDKFFETAGEELPEGIAEDFDEEADDQVDTPEGDTEESAPPAPEPAKESSAEDERIRALEQERDNYKKAMDSERIRRKEDQQSLSELAELKEHVKQLTQNLTKNKPEASEIDFDEQPLEALKKLTEDLAAKQSDFDNYRKQEQEKVQIQQEFESFKHEISIKTKEFATQTPDYYDAYTHLMESRLNELKIYGLDEKQIQESLAKDELDIAFTAMNSGKNPAEIVYNLSRHRGYVSKAQEQMTQASEKLDRIEKGSSLSKSLGGAGGNVSADLSPDSINDMSQSEIDRLVSNDDAWHKLVGSA